MNLKITIFGIITSLAIMFVILELVRRRALKERYAILWLVLAIILMVLSIWGSLLDKIADLLNIYYAPSILFSLSLIFVFAIMIHFSVVLSKQGKGYHKMAQRLSILEERLQKMNQEEGSQPQNAEDTQENGPRKDKIADAQGEQREEKAGTKAP